MDKWVFRKLTKSSARIKIILGCSESTQRKIKLEIPRKSKSFLMNPSIFVLFYGQQKCHMMNKDTLKVQHSTNPVNCATTFLRTNEVLVSSQNNKMVLMKMNLRSTYFIRLNRIFSVMM